MHLNKDEIEIGEPLIFESLCVFRKTNFSEESIN